MKWNDINAITTIVNTAASYRAGSRTQGLAHASRALNLLTYTLSPLPFLGWSFSEVESWAEKPLALSSALLFRIQEGKVWVPHSTKTEERAGTLPEQSQEKQWAHTSGEGAPAEHPEPRAAGAHPPGGRAAERASEPSQHALHRGLHDDVPH